jgi:hypothetical protein
MKTTKLLAIALALLLWRGASVFGQAEEPAPQAPPAAAGEATAGHEGAASEGAAHDSAAHEGAPREGTAHEGGAREAGPVVPDTRHRWPFPVLFIILMTFLAAAVLGPIIRAQSPPEMPPTHSHDEPPGASHHHGESGTINPIPADVAKLEQGDAHGHGHHH